MPTFALLAGDGEEAVGFDRAAPEQFHQGAVQRAVGRGQIGPTAGVIVRKPDMGRAVDTEGLGDQGGGIDRGLINGPLKGPHDRQGLALLVGDQCIEVFYRAAPQVGHRLGGLPHRNYFTGAEVPGGFGDDLGAGGVGTFRVVTE